ncbi:MAG: GxxExxY protein, partial [Wenzhouxiangellaceae bacterium]
MKTLEPQIAQIRADYESESRDPETHAVIGAAMEVHRELGPGFLEAVYHQASQHEFGLRSIPYEREYELPVHYKKFVLDCRYRVDFLCYENLLVEIKAVQSIGAADSAQVINYLKAGRCSR